MFAVSADSALQLSDHVILDMDFPDRAVLSHQEYADWLVGIGQVGA